MSKMTANSKQIRTTGVFDTYNKNTSFMSLDERSIPKLPTQGGYSIALGFRSGPLVAGNTSSTDKVENDFCLHPVPYITKRLCLGIIWRHDHFWDKNTVTAVVCSSNSERQRTTKPCNKKARDACEQNKRNKQDNLLPLYQGDRKCATTLT